MSNVVRFTPNRAGKSQFTELCAIAHMLRTGEPVIVCGPNGREKWTLVKEPMAAKPEEFKVWLDELLESK